MSSLVLKYSDFLNREKALHEKQFKFLGLNKIICYCTSTTESQIKELLKSKDIKTFQDLKFKSKAGLMCHGCHKDLENLYQLFEKNEKTEVLIPKRRVNDQNKRVMVQGFYPAYWIEQIQKHQKDWIERENFKENFYFEIIDAQIPYVDFKLSGDLSDQKKEHYFQHFNEYINLKTNFNWYFELL